MFIVQYKEDKIYSSPPFDAKEKLPYKRGGRTFFGTPGSAILFSGNSGLTLNGNRDLHFNFLGIGIEQFISLGIRDLIIIFAGVRDHSPSYPPSSME